LFSRNIGPVPRVACADNGVDTMRTTTAYFAGVGTVAVAIAAGLGGGLLFANIVAPHGSKYAAEPTKLEQRMSARTIPMTSAPSEPAPPAVVQPSASTTPVIAAAPTQIEAQPQKQSPAEQQASNATPPQPATSPSQAAAPTEPAAREPAPPRAAFAKARDSDVKRTATEKRHTDRDQKWVDRRRMRQPREQELEAVERAVRDDTEPRQAFATEAVRLDMPRVQLFGDDW
jgi:hypothetical protein